MYHFFLLDFIPPSLSFLVITVVIVIVAIVAVVIINFISFFYMLSSQLRSSTSLPIPLLTEGKQMSGCVVLDC